MTETAKGKPEYSPDLLYKFLLENGQSPFAYAAWKLPGSGLEAPGEWMRPVTDLAECRRGYHLCRERDLLGWTSSPALYVAEGRGARLEADDKVVYESARLLYRLETWSKRARALWAADCAEHVLHIFEERYPHDPRPRRAIEAVRAYWAGAADLETVRKAAGAALFASDRACTAKAAYYAAKAAYYAAKAAYYAAKPAYATAHADTSCVDSFYAASYATDAATAYADEAQQREREWQLGRLLEYLWPERKEEE